MQGGTAPPTLPCQQGLPFAFLLFLQHTLQTLMERVLLESQGNRKPPSAALPAPLPLPPDPKLLPAPPPQKLLPRQGSLPWCSLMQNSSPDYSQVLENTEVRQAIWPSGDVQVTWRHRERLGVWGQAADPQQRQSRIQRDRPPVISSRVSNTLSCSGCRGAVLEAGSLEGGLGGESAWSRTGTGWLGLPECLHLNPLPIKAQLVPS